MHSLRKTADSSVHDAQAHPEFNGNDGQIMYVTYSHSTGAFTSELRLVSVELEAAKLSRLAGVSEAGARWRNLSALCEGPQVVGRDGQI